MRTNLLLALAMLTITFSACKKDNDTDSFNYDCKIKWTQFDSNDGELMWFENYFLNDYQVKYTDSWGANHISRYDSYGNIIESINGSYKTTYEYNSFNKLILRRHYEGSVLDYYYSYHYIDTLLSNSFKIDGDGDTLNFWNRYYGDDNILDSTISNNQKDYHYFSENMDSTISFTMSGTLRQREVRGYESNKLVYYKFENFQILPLYTIFQTWDYNENGLLEEYVFDYVHSYPEQNRWEKKVYTYNVDLEIGQINYLDRTDNLLNYDIYSYTDEILTEVRNYSPDSELNYYWIIENSCGAAYKNDLLKELKYPTFVNDNQKKRKNEIIP